MKTIVALFLLVSIDAYAEIGALFPNEGAVLLIQGNDTDAHSLYECMNVSPVVDGDAFVKQITYTSFGRPVFDLTCKQSQATSVASCTLKFFSPEAVVNKAQKSVLMGINDQFDAPKIARLFNQTSSDSYRAEVFLSADHKLHIWKAYGPEGNVRSLTISFN